LIHRLICMITDSKVGRVLSDYGQLLLSFCEEATLLWLLYILTVVLTRKRIVNDIVSCVAVILQATFYISK